MNPPQNHNHATNPQYGSYQDTATDDTDESDSSVACNNENNIPSLSCAFLASLTTGGITYAFGLYGSALKQSLHFTQGQLDTISSANFCAGLFSWIPGLCVDRFGPKFSMSTGGISGALSLILYWAIAKQVIIVPASWTVSVLSFVGVLTTLSSAMVTGSVFKIIVTSTGPGTKGSAVGVAKGYVGLGAGAYATLFQRIRGENQSDLDFLPMAAFFALLAATVPALLLLPSHDGPSNIVAAATSPKLVDAATPLHFQTLYASLTAMAILVIGNSLFQLYHAHVTAAATEELESRAYPGSRSYVMAIMVVAVWFIPVLSLMCLPQGSQNQHQLLPRTDSSELDDEEDPIVESMETTDGGESDDAVVSTGKSSFKRECSLDDDTEEPSPCNDNATRIVSNGGKASDVELTTEICRDRNPFEMLQTWPAWFFLWTATILVGSGTVMTNNMGQMVEALDFPNIVAPSALALFSVAQAASRVATGSLSEAAMSWRLGPDGHGFSRPVFLVIASLASAISHAMLGVTTREVTFVIGVALSGAAFGMVWPLMVLIIGEIFGPSYIAANYLIYDGCTSAAGTLLLSKFVAQDVYESHIQPGGDGVTCYGLGCFRLSHFIVAALALTSIVTSVGVLLTTRHIYKSGRVVVGH